MEDAKVSRTRSTVYLSAARVVGIVVQLVSVPIVWNVIGAAKFGACIFLLAISRWVGLIDAGMLDGAQRKMTLAFDGGRLQEGFGVWRTYRSVLFVNALLGVGLFLLLALFVHIPDLGAGQDWIGLFFASGTMFAAQYLYLGASTYFNARRQFGRLAVSNGVQSLLSGVFSLGLTLYFRSPTAYVAGFAIANFGVMLYNLGTIERQAHGIAGVRWFDRRLFSETAKFGLKLLPTRVATVTMQTFDRIIITNTLGSAAMAPYGVASRLPEAAHETLPITMTLMPDLTKAHSEGEQAFAKEADRSTRIALMVGCGLILVPCAFAEPVLRVWLGSKYIPAMAAIMVAIGFYRALEMFYSSLALAMIAHGSPGRVFPFTMYNAVMLLGLVYPAALYYGIVGVALLRVGIHLLQFGPLVAFAHRTVVPGLALGPWLGRLLGVLATAAVISALGVLSWSTPMVRQSPWTVFILAPVAMIVFFTIVDRLGFAEVPDGVSRRLKTGINTVTSAFRKPVG